MQLFTSWTKPNEIIASDMPWAVAWYSDRKSLWLPAKLETFTEFYNLHTLGPPIAGIYLTPVSRDLGYASQISNGEYKEWLPLILPNPKALTKLDSATTCQAALNYAHSYSQRRLQTSIFCPAVRGEPTP
jgi:hypothetical protein